MIPRGYIILNIPNFIMGFPTYIPPYSMATDDINMIDNLKEKLMERLMEAEMQRNGMDADTSRVVPLLMGGLAVLLFSALAVFLFRLWWRRNHVARRLQEQRVREERRRSPEDRSPGAASRKHGKGSPQHGDGTHKGPASKGRATGHSTHHSHHTPRTSPRKGGGGGGDTPPPAHTPRRPPPTKGASPPHAQRAQGEAVATTEAEGKKRKIDACEARRKRLKVERARHVSEPQLPRVLGPGQGAGPGPGLGRARVLPARSRSEGKGRRVRGALSYVVVCDGAALARSPGGALRRQMDAIMTKVQQLQSLRNDASPPGEDTSIVRQVEDAMAAFLREARHYRTPSDPPRGDRTPAADDSAVSYWPSPNSSFFDTSDAEGHRRVSKPREPLFGSPLAESSTRVCVNISKNSERVSVFADINNSICCNFDDVNNCSTPQTEKIVRIKSIRITTKKGETMNFKLRPTKEKCEPICATENNLDNSHELNTDHYRFDTFIQAGVSPGGKENIFVVEEKNCEKSKEQKHNVFKPSNIRNRLSNETHTIWKRRSISDSKPLDTTFIIENYELDEEIDRNLNEANNQRDLGTKLDFRISGDKVDEERSGQLIPFVLQAISSRPETNYCLSCLSPEKERNVRDGLDGLALTLHLLVKIFYFGANSAEVEVYSEYIEMLTGRILMPICTLSEKTLTVEDIVYVILIHKALMDKDEKCWTFLVGSIIAKMGYRFFTFVDQFYN